MSLLNTIKAQQLLARKNKESLKASLLTTLIGEAAVIGKNDGNRETTNAEVITVVQKFLKGVNESINFMGDKNPDVISMLNNERQILETYLPKQLTVFQLQVIISDQIDANVLKKDPSLKGSAMKYLKDKYAGQYDSKMAIVAVENVLKA